MPDCRIRRGVDVWSASTFVLAVIVLAPLVLVVGGLGAKGPEWDHIASTVLGGYVWNTLVVSAIVVALAIVFAIPPAWLVSVFEFPGRRVFEWVLVMPLAIPTYVAGFVYYQGQESALPLLVSIKQAWGFDSYLMAERLLRYGLLSLLLASVLYPYLFVSARASFSRQRRGTIEAAQTLGRGPWSAFFSVALPMARPAFAAGIGLIVMEVVNDYGAVHFFGVPTLTEGIFRTWFGLGDRASALRIAGMVMLAILLLVGLERAQRGRARFAETAVDSTPLARRALRGRSGVLAVLVCLIPLTFGLLVPLRQLLIWAAPTAGTLMHGGFWGKVGNSIGLSAATAAGLAALALLFAYSLRLHRGPWLSGIARLATLGYAVPGAVVAVGVMVSFGAIDRWHGAPLLGGTALAIAFAYLVRFVAVSFNPVRSGMERICGSLDESSRLLGRSPAATLARINLPLIWPTLVAAMMLVFVETLKELPLTMILRPANFETLSTTAFGLAKEGRFRECSVPALLIVFAGAAGLMVLNRLLIARKEP